RPASTTKSGDDRGQESSDANLLNAVPGYEILSEVGRGSMGVVYKARQQSLGRTVTLKVLKAGVHAGPEAVTRFRGAAEAVARLQHPNIVQIYEVDAHNGLPYLVLEFVGGDSLADRLKGVPWPAREAAALVETLARAMHTAHQSRIIHRDLTPGNVLLTTDGVPKITDFGLAERLDASVGHTPTGEIVRTP